MNVQHNFSYVQYRNIKHDLEIETIDYFHNKIGVQNPKIQWIKLDGSNSVIMFYIGKTKIFINLDENIAKLYKLGDYVKVKKINGSWGLFK